MLRPTVLALAIVSYIQGGYAEDELMRFTPISDRLLGIDRPSQFSYNSLTARVLQEIILSERDEAEANNPDNVIISFDKLIFTDLTTLPHLDGVHLFFDDGRMFYGRIERVIQGPCVVNEECELLSEQNICCNDSHGLNTCYSQISLSDGWQLDIDASGLKLYDNEGNLLLEHAGKKSCTSNSEDEQSSPSASTDENESSIEEGDRTRRLAVGACSGSGCGAVRVSPYVRNRSSQGPCTFRTGIYGIYDPCNTPAVVASNYADPVTLGLARYKPGGMVLPDRVTFAERNGWI